MTCQQYLRQASLHAANDCISNVIAALPIFPYYSFDLDGVLSENPRLNRHPPSPHQLS